MEVGSVVGILVGAGSAMALAIGAMWVMLWKRQVAHDLANAKRDADDRVREREHEAAIRVAYAEGAKALAECNAGWSGKAEALRAEHVGDLRGLRDLAEAVDRMAEQRGTKP